MSDHARDHGDRHSPGGPDPIPGLGGGGDGLWVEDESGLHPVSDPTNFYIYTTVDDVTLAAENVVAISAGGPASVIATGQLDLAGNDVFVSANDDLTLYAAGEATLSTSFGDVVIGANGSDTTRAFVGAEGSVAISSDNETSSGFQGVEVNAKRNVWLRAGTGSFGGFIQLDGDYVTVTAPIQMNGSPIEDLADPTNAQDATTKAYVDAIGNPGGTWATAVKSADETVNNSSTLQDDNHLSFTAASGKAYEIEIILFYDDSTGGTPDLKFAFGEDSTARGSFIEIGLAIGDTAASASARSNLSDVFSTGTSTTTRVVKASGVHMGAGGTFKLQWAQNTANVSDTVVRQGSFIRYRPLN